MDLGETGNKGEVGVVEGGKTVIRMYCMREQSTFNKRIPNVCLQNTQCAVKNKFKLCVL